jgi:hypothetical protein
VNSEIVTETVSRRGHEVEAEAREVEQEGEAVGRETTEGRRFDARREKVQEGEKEMTFVHTKIMLLKNKR